MKRLTLLLISLMSILASLTVYAKDGVNKIDMRLEISENGDAHIEQIWQGQFNDGTECYIVIGTDEPGAITDFTVSDDTQRYKTVKNWNTESSFEEKANKCGIVSYENKCELCFGISEYGQRTYTINYTIKNFVREYSECDGFNYMLVNPNMNIFPANADVCIFMEDGKTLSEENAFAQIRGCAAKGEFSDGKLFVKSTKPLEGSDCLIIALDIMKGMINPSGKDTAKEADSAGIDSKTVYSIFAMACFAALVLALVVPMKDKFKAGEHTEAEGRVHLAKSPQRRRRMTGNTEIIYKGIISLMACGSIEIENERIHLKNPPIKREEYNMYRVFLNASHEESEISFDKLLEYMSKNPAQLENFFINSNEDTEFKDLESLNADRGAAKQLSYLMCAAKEK